MKACFKCGIEKPLSEYYRHKKMSDGYLGKCKECTKADVTAHRNANIERVRAYDMARAKLDHRVAAAKAVTARRRAENPEMYMAHCLVNNAVRDGRLKKPSQCQWCGRVARIHGHHDDYSKPLDVMWLCAPCHKQRHKQLLMPERLSA